MPVPLIVVCMAVVVFNSLMIRRCFKFLRKLQARQAWEAEDLRKLNNQVNPSPTADPNPAMDAFREQLMTEHYGPRP